MRRSMSILSQTWFEIAKKINGIIFSFIFFWGSVSFLSYIRNIVPKDLSIILSIVFMLAPFIISAILLNFIDIRQRTKRRK